MRFWQIYAALLLLVIICLLMNAVGDYMNDRCQPITPTIYHASADEPLFHEVWRP